MKILVKKFGCRKSIFLFSLYHQNKQELSLFHSDRCIVVHLSAKNTPVHQQQNPGIQTQSGGDGGSRAVLFCIGRNREPSDQTMFAHGSSDKKFGEPVP